MASLTPRHMDLGGRWACRGSSSSGCEMLPGGLRRELPRGLRWGKVGAGCTFRWLRPFPVRVSRRKGLLLTFLVLGWASGSQAVIALVSRGLMVISMTISVGAVALPIVGVHWGFPHWKIEVLEIAKFGRIFHVRVCLERKRKAKTFSLYQGKRQHKVFGIRQTARTTDFNI